jgi:hypothetical protein
MVTLVLDGIDECPLPNTTKNLSSLLRELFSQVDISGLRVLLGCRTADYPGLIDSTLREAFPAFGVYELAPLTRADVHALSASRCVDPEAFLTAVTVTGSGPLASIPLTLDLLLLRYVETGGLHGGASDLYETSLRALADEPDPDRDPHQRVPGSGEQHLAVAARLCSYLLLCGRAAFWIRAAGLGPPSDLDPLRLAGGEEVQTGGSFAVTPELVQAALRTALFGSRGPGRLGPVHATFAAFLAARHLASCDLPDAQLRNLLTTASDTGSVGIVPSLRETAAWLAALRPESTAWLADVEPTSLAAHAAVIDDSAIRRLIVERLLADPSAARHRPWGRGWPLAHPGLAEQLSNVLSPLADRSLPAPTQEQAYLALSLTRDAQETALLPTLLDIAARTDALPHFRSMAIATAADFNREVSAPILRDVLTEIQAEPQRDPDDEIRGALLEALWPEHLSATDLVAALTRPRRSDFFGLYANFRSHLFQMLADDDVPHLLRWALVGSSVGEPEMSVDGVVSDLPFRDAELVAGLLERAFLCQDTDTIIDPAADLIALQLRSFRDLNVPEALDRRDDEGREPPESIMLRRSVAVAVLERLGEAHANLLVHWGWHPAQTARIRFEQATKDGRHDYPAARSGLLDKADLAWAIEQALVIQPEKLGQFIPVVRSLFDPNDSTSRETVCATAGTPLWSAFAPWFDAVPLGGDEEAQARQAYEWTRSRPRKPVWEKASEHAAGVLDLYNRATTEPSAFWRLLYSLQVDPATGGGFIVHGDDVTTRPGVALLPDGWLQNLIEAAWVYLHDGVPSGDEFLDQPNMTNWAIQAGYLALALLVRYGTSGRNLESLEDTVVVAWTGAVLVFPAVPFNAGDRNLKQELLRRLAVPARDQLPRLLHRIVAGHITLGWRPSELELLDDAYSDEIGDVLVRCLADAVAALAAALESGSSPPATATNTPEVQEEGADPNEGGRAAGLTDTVGLIVSFLARNRHPKAAESGMALIAAAAEPEAKEASIRAGRVAATALLVAQGFLWSDVRNRMLPSPTLTRLVLQDLSREWMTPSLLLSLSDRQLAELWELLVDYWPYHQDVTISGAHTVGPDEQAQHWRDTVLDTLTKRGTSEAAILLTQLADRHTTLPWLIDRVRVAEEREREQQWAPLAPEELTELLTNRRARLVRDSADLSNLVADALVTASSRLARTGQLLWNNYRLNGVERWRPKSEPDVGAWLAEQLTLELVNSGVVVNREVLVRQTTSRGHGLAVDIQADAPLTSDQHGRRADPARCRVELKGNWNPDLLTAMRTQLADDYLLPEGLRDGLYVTAWFDVNLWDDPNDGRLTTAQSRDRDTTAAALAAQADALRQLNLRVRSVIIDIPRPTPSARGI